MTEKNIKKRLSTFFQRKYLDFILFLWKNNCDPFEKKSTLSFSTKPLKKFGSCQDPALFSKIPCKVRKAERRVQTIWGVPVPSFLISFCINTDMHMCWSLSLITFHALQLQYFSIQFSTLHIWQVYINSKIWKELFWKICESNKNYLRLKSPKQKLIYSKITI